MMVKQKYTVTFTTPAFLGDAEQNGTWRIPPFKALLRQWWRIAAAKNYNYGYKKLREAEGSLFGNAWLDGNFQKSKIKMRLNDWRHGKMQRWNESEKKVVHPEVKFPVDANLYLGYGPLIYNKTTKRAALKTNAAIQADEGTELHLAYPKDLKVFVNVFQLIHWFGTLGGRSRNGWGSLDFSSNEIGFESLSAKNPLLQTISHPLAQCLEHDWPHALGKDERGLLIWRTIKPSEDWKSAMLELAKAKINLRTSLKFTNPSGQIDHRHLLAYPVTNHKVKTWGDQARLANQLRFKVSKTSEGYIGIAYHLPCALPTLLLNALNPTDQRWVVGEQLGVWQSVHKKLDSIMQRI